MAHHLNQIESMLALSTSHIDEKTIQTLDVNTTDEFVIYPKGEYGWFIYVPEDRDYQASPALEACFALARSANCCWLMFDRDAQPNDALPTFNW